MFICTIGICILGIYYAVNGIYHASQSMQEPTSISCDVVDGKSVPKVSSDSSHVRHRTMKYLKKM